ncbi:MAG: hypothetical protein AAF587_13170 [Bacteroidota bacterium]
MKDSKLFSFLRLLTAWEMNHLLDFVHSPFFNKHHRVKRMADYLADAHPEFASEQLSRASLGAYTFEGQAYSEQALSDVMSYLTRLIEKFLAIRHILADEFDLAYHLLQELGDRGMEKAWRKQWKRMKKMEHRPEAYAWHQQHLLESEHLQAEFRWGGRTSGQHIQPLIHSLDSYYLTTRLRYACAHLNRQKLLRDESQLPGMEWVLALVDAVTTGHTSDSFQLLEAYRRIFILLQEPARHEHFSHTQDYLIRHHDLLSHANQKELFAYLMNFCIQHINQGLDRYRGILFDLYQWQLAKGILQEEGHLSPWDVKNMVSLALKMQKFEWVDEFLQKVESLIKPEFRAHAITYNLAMLRYEQKRPREVLRLLRDTEFSDTFYQLGAKTLLIKIYYETPDLEALFSLLDTFEAYLKRPRLLPMYQRELYLRLVRFVRKLARFKGKMLGGYQMVKRSQLTQLTQKVAAQTAVAQQDWLKIKCEEMLRDL